MLAYIDLVHDLNSENCLDLTFVASPYEKVVFVSDTKILEPENRPSNLSPTGLRPCGSNWVNRRSSIKNQLTQSDNGLNVDQKWLKNYDDPLHPYRSIAV